METTSSSSTASDSMASLVSSLSESFKEVPPSAIPPMLDGILASTRTSPSALFTSLLDSFPNFTEDKIMEVKESKLTRAITSLVCALCHLLKKCGVTDDVLQAYISKAYIPLMKIVHLFDTEIINQVAEPFFGVVTETNAWRVLEDSLVPFLIRSIGVSTSMLQSSKVDIFEPEKYLITDSVTINGAVSENGKPLMSSGFLALPTSCHCLAQILDAALEREQATSKSVSILPTAYDAEKFAVNLLSDICSLSESLLSQDSQQRSYAISFLFPVIFKAFTSFQGLDIAVQGQTYVVFRKLFIERVWKCCKKLLSQGHLERTDALHLLSVLFSFYACEEERYHKSRSGREEGFDIRDDKVFWDEIKRGLVDKESHVRKQSLHILKMSLMVNKGNQNNSGLLDPNLQERHLKAHRMTKRELWANKEARSLGVGEVCRSIQSSDSSQRHWEAFLLLYEMLEEYGTHLVEAAWNHQISVLLHFCGVHDSRGSTDELINNNHLTFGNFSDWLSILWERGFIHDNPIVRCLILESFLGIEWKNFGSCAKPLPEAFILGPLMQGLNDPVHHKDFGVKGVYSSKVIDGAVQFLYEYTGHIRLRRRITFLINLASLAKQQSFGRAGLIALSECIASVARRIGNDCGMEVKRHESPILHVVPVTHAAHCSPSSEQTDLLDALRYVADSCKQHFNPRYRLQVCGKILKAASSLVCSSAVSFEMLLHFISTFPKEFTGYGGSLRLKVKGWLLSCQKKGCISSCTADMNLLKSLDDFPYTFIRYHHPEGASFTFDDEDLVAWECEARRWVMVLFLIQTEEYHFESILRFITKHSLNVSEESNTFEWLPVKYLILLSSLILELREIQEKSYRHGYNIDRISEVTSPDKLNESNHINASISEKFLQTFLFVLNDLVSYANLLSSIFWSTVEDPHLPNSVRGKLGGPSQRRLSSVLSTSVLQAITSVKTVACISLWCVEMTSDDSPKIAFDFLWNFLWRTISSSNRVSETGAELHLAAYEALASVLRTLASGFSSSIAKVVWEKDNFGMSDLGGKPLLDSLVLTFLEHINKLLGVGVLVRTRRAVLMNAKWTCLESLLAIPFQIVDDGVKLKGCKLLFSDTAVRWIYSEIVDSLENAGEDSVLSMLRSVRLILGLFASGRLGSLVSLPISQDNQIMWQLVRSSWLLHVSCNKRRVAAISALLSSVLHPFVFDDENMHMKDNACGPLKWFVEKILEEGTKSPRTIRLAALHLTGLWLSNPGILKYYIKELKLLSLHGSVAFDEDFEAELAENHGAKADVSLLSKSLDPELTEAFINTELYARVSVAVLFQKLADLADANRNTSENNDCAASLEAGKLFLLELLDSVVTEKDLSKELYKKYSAIHRRKIRAWQMICVLTKFVSEDIVDKVTHSLHIALHRNNLPAVRQYLETFAINVFLKFPSLVQEQLVPILHDYDIKPQALSSYVFIAANIILHAPYGVQYRHLDNLLPAIIPLLTSHHHSLRGFTQLLVYKVLSKLYPLGDLRASEDIPLERRSFDNLLEYLAKNSDCKRLRISMEGYLDAYNPEVSATPKGIFINRIEDLEFECVPTSLMDQVLSFLNDVREDLRHSMAKDSVTIKNESLKIDEDKKEALSCPCSGGGDLIDQQLEDSSTNFQRKFALSKSEKQEFRANCFLDLSQTYKTLLEIDKEDQLLDQLLQSRIATMDGIRGCRQEIILVASLLDRIPNLAGLARTCEVFKASGLAIADANILCDKQFQLISVTAEKWVPIIEVPIESLKGYLEKKRREGFSILGLEQTANSVPLDQYAFPGKTVLVLGREKEGIPVDIIHILDACIEIPQLGVVRSLNVHVSGAIAIWEYTRQQRAKYLSI